MPAYNEAESIEKVIANIRKNNPSADLLIINDGSIDETETIMERKMSGAEGLFLINLPYNLGIGAAIQTGFKFAQAENYDICVQCDGDGQHPAYQIPKLINAVINDNLDLAIGSRFKMRYSYKSTFARIIGIWCLSKLISILIGQNITDATIGFRAFGRRAIDFFSEIYPADYPEPESLVLAHKRGLRIGEVPVRIRQRRHGESSIGVLGGIYYMLKNIIAIIIDLFKKISGGERC